MPKRDAVPSPSRQDLYDRNRYSPAIKSNGFLFVSGQVGSLEDGSPQPGLKAQVRQAFENLNAVLKAAGSSFDDVVDVTVFMVDPANTFEEVWEVVPEYWGEAPYPTLTAVGVTWLYGYDFEIKVIARLPHCRPPRCGATKARGRAAAGCDGCLRLNSEHCFGRFLAAEILVSVDLRALLAGKVTLRVVHVVFAVAHERALPEELAHP